MAIALEEVDVVPENNSHRREVSLEQMQEFIADTDDPQAQTAMVLFAKTGIRKSELVNLDLRDLYIDHPGARRELPKPRSEITGNPDSLFIADNRVSKGDVVNGDRRTAGNKRKNTTVVPLDDELKQTLLYWIAARPPSKSEALPLFVMRTDGSSERKAGDRVTKGAIGAAVRRRATERGWYTKSGGVQGNVTPHYFRHWFTTMAEQNGMSRPIVKYLRGDVGNDIVDRNYRHFWNNEVRTEYINTIYKLFPS
jgi:integrase